MIGYTTGAVLFWVAVVGFTLGGCWLVDWISTAIDRRRVRRDRLHAPIRTTVPRQRARR